MSVLSPPSTPLGISEMQSQIVVQSHRDFAFIFIGCLLTGCSGAGGIADSSAAVLSTSPRTYAAIGGAELGTPFHRDGRVHIPLALDVNGDAFWHHDSVSTIRSIKTSRDGQQITFSVLTSTKTSSPPVAHELVMNGLTPGRYSVSYEDPDGSLHFVGEFILGVR